jgi:hypothetical protein
MPGILVEHFDGLAPSRNLRRADLAQIQNLTLHYPAAIETGLRLLRWTHREGVASRVENVRNDYMIVIVII